MIIKVIIVIFILIGLSLYVVVHGSARSVDDEMQRRLDEEQAQIVSELSRTRDASESQGSSRIKNTDKDV